MVKELGKLRSMIIEIPRLTKNRNMGWMAEDNSHHEIRNPPLYLKLTNWRLIPYHAFMAIAALSLYLFE